MLVTEREGIVYKRVFNYLTESGKLFLVSDNRQYATYQIDGTEVMEVWSAKAFISLQFPDENAKNEMSVEHLANVVLEMQKELNALKTKK